MNRLYQHYQQLSRTAVALFVMLLTMTAQTAWADSFNVTANGVNWACTVIDGTTNVKIKPTSRSSISGPVDIPENVQNGANYYTVTEIDSNAFDSCNDGWKGGNYNGNLTSITVPASVTKIGYGAFYNCSNLATYSGGDGVTVIEGGAFQLCRSLTSFTIPSGVTEIQPYTFQQSGLTRIAIPANVTKIYQYAFGKCGSLESVSIPASVTEIINNPFSGCNNLSSITVDEGNLNYKIVDGVLYSKDDKTLIAYPIPKSGTTYTIPASVTKIVDEAFSGCSGLTSVTIPASVTSIGNNAFEKCTGLTSVTIPAGVTNIEMCAFQGCSGLTSVTIPASVTIIDQYAFEGCKSLTSVTIPAGVTSIGSFAFNSCSNLASVTIYAKELDMGDMEVFSGNADGRIIYVFNDIVRFGYGWSSYTGAIQNIPEAQLTVSGVTLNENPGATGEYWCTYYHPAANVKINTDGVEIFKARLNNTKDKVTLVKMYGSVIMAGQAVMLKASTSGPLSMELTSTASSDDFSYNDLKGGSDVPAGYDAYILSAAGDPLKMGFYMFDGSLTNPATTLNPNKAHLEIPTPPSGARGFIGFDEDDATGIEAVENVQCSMFNVQSDSWYSLDGRRLSAQPTRKGIYVKNGQKFIVK